MPNLQVPSRVTPLSTGGFLPRVLVSLPGQGSNLRQTD